MRYDEVANQGYLEFKVEGYQPNGVGPARHMYWLIRVNATDVKVIGDGRFFKTANVLPNETIKKFGSIGDASRHVKAIVRQAYDSSGGDKNKIQASLQAALSPVWQYGAAAKWTAK